jgi:NTP pyrophosphatase (non-canonical NTP hydrolase)
MSDLRNLLNKIKKFTGERDWDQFHNPKDLAISVALEASELLEHFQWKSQKEVKKYIKTHKEEIGDEIADVMIYITHLSEKVGINLLEACERKLEKNKKKYPIAKSKGKNTKYTDLWKSKKMSQ